MIVTRGLGTRTGILVTAGLGLSIAIAIVTPLTNYNHQAPTISYTQVGTARVLRNLPSLRLTYLIKQIEARGAANVLLLKPVTQAKVNIFEATGAATVSLLGVPSNSRLGAILAKGKHDLTDEQIASMILALLDS